MEWLELQCRCEGTAKSQTYWLVIEDESLFIAVMPLLIIGHGGPPWLRNGLRKQ